MSLSTAEFGAPSRPTFVYGGHDGSTDYFFFTGATFRSNLGIENTTASYNPVHDHTAQGREFSYVSTQIDPDTRLTYIGGSFIGRYQIPNTPGVAPRSTAFGQSDFDSSRIDQRQNEFHELQRRGPAAFGRRRRLAALVFPALQHRARQARRALHLLFNGVASDVYRSSLVNGIQSDNAWRITPPDHTLRFGFYGSVEQTLNNNNTIVLPLDGSATPSMRRSTRTTGRARPRPRQRPTRRTNGRSPTA